jgi:hypothetical protein
MTPPELAAVLDGAGITASMADHLTRCMRETRDTGRGAAVVLRIAVKIDKESGSTVAIAKLAAKWPKDAARAEECKAPPILISEIAAEADGQMRIEDGADDT